MPSKTRTALLGAVSVLCLFAMAARAMEPASLVGGFPRGRPVLETAGPRCLVLDVYYASTPEQRTQGLMFVRTMAEFEGMYFGTEAPAEITMWMKNTILPLDMLFIGSDGTVARVAADTRPYSTARISSGGPVIGVLEVHAGFARRWRVTEGTRLLF